MLIKGNARAISGMNEADVSLIRLAERSIGLSAGALRNRNRLSGRPLIGDDKDLVLWIEEAIELLVQGLEVLHEAAIHIHKRVSASVESHRQPQWWEEGRAGTLPPGER
jgi:hypothetical protein